MGKRRKETGSVISQVQAKHFASNASCFHQKIVLSPEVVSETGKIPLSEQGCYHDLVPKSKTIWSCEFTVDRAVQAV